MKATSIRLSDEVLNDLETIKHHMALENNADAIRWVIRFHARRLKRMEERSQRMLLRRSRNKPVDQVDQR